MLKLRETLTRWEAGRLSQLEAAEILGMSERTFRRWAHRFEADGETGLTDHRLGRRAGHGVPSEWEKEVARLYQGRYKGLTETIAAKGLFSSFYTDRGSRYFLTPETGGKVSKDALTQVARALARLNIEHIAAYSPEARGRSERMFRTLQGRLPKDFALAGIVDDVTAANRYLREVFVPLHNRLLTVKPDLEESAFVPAGDLA